MNKLCQISAMFQLCWAVELMSTGRRTVTVMTRGQEDVRKELCIAEGFSEVGGSRAGGICRWTVHICAVVTIVVLCWWGGKGSCF